MKIKFCGAAQIVTGSSYLIDTGNTKFLVDCGMFQGPKEINKLNYQEFLFDPKQIDFVLLTHAHLDHCGLLPKLVKQGFKGQIYATGASIDLTEIILEDSAEVQKENTEHENRRRLRRGEKPRQALYTPKDVQSVMPLFQEVIYEKTYNISDNIKVRFLDAGHILGSASIEVFVEDKKLVFSGDIGQRNVPIIQDPTIIQEADYVFMESTYGDRLHEEKEIRDDLLAKYVQKIYQRGGKVYIPSFAIERTQELLYSFNKLIQNHQFPNEKIYLDSPLAIKATEIFKKHKNLFDKEAVNKYPNAFDFQELEYTPSKEDSMRLNSLDKPCIIIAGSGMCTAGRIRHHLKHGIRNPSNMVLFVGYQAEGTLGRHILEGDEYVKMMGQDIIVQAEVQKINSFSAHADADELIKWASGFTQKPQKLFIVHGEPDSMFAIKKRLEEEVNMNCYIPYLGETVEL